MPAHSAAKAAAPATPNLEQAVPFLLVSDMDASLAFYSQGLAFKLQRQWTPRGRIEWCMLERDGVRLMLQLARDGVPGDVGRGVTIYVFCKDALAIYHEARTAGLAVEKPAVGNGMWVTDFIDPDGYRISFESETDAAEESVYDG